MAEYDAAAPRRSAGRRFLRDLFPLLRRPGPWRPCGARRVPAGSLVRARDRLGPRGPRGAAPVARTDGWFRGHGVVWPRRSCIWSGTVRGRRWALRRPTRCSMPPRTARWASRQWTLLCLPRKSGPALQVASSLADGLRAWAVRAGQWRQKTFHIGITARDPCAYGRLV